jgi:hypothetical protein
MELKLNDFVLVESKVDLVKQRQQKSKAEGQQQQTSVYEELINESSNTNYSIEDEDAAAAAFEYIIQIKAIGLDTGSPSFALLQGKVYLRPAAAASGSGGDTSSNGSYKLTELESAYDSDNLETFDVDSLKFMRCVNVDQTEGL